MVRSIFTLFDQAASVLSAQRARLGHATFRRTLDSAGRLAGIVLLRSIEQAERTHEAMIARGYQGCQPEAGLPPLTRRDAALRAACVVLLAAVAGGGKAAPVTDPANELPAIEAERIGYAYPDGVARAGRTFPFTPRKENSSP